MPADKARIYISSTYSDLKEYREAVYRTLRQMEHDVVAMEDYVAADQRPLAKCVADVASCDVYVGIFAWRYGYIPVDDNPLQKSITELEYLEAEKRNLPRLIFLLREEAEWPDEKRDVVTGDGEKGGRIAALRSLLGTDHLASFFNSPDELAKLVTIAVTKTLKTIRTPFMAEPLGEFVQRPAEFDALRKLLLDEDRSAPVAITAALRGAGGFGKTTLARALCHDAQVRTAFDGGILWVTLGENPTNILGSVEDLIFTLAGERPGFTNVQAAANRLKELLAQRAALLVIDDVWNNAHLTPFLQGGERCAYLITTRNSDTLPAQAKQIPVDAMQQREAVSLLVAGIESAEPHYDQLLTLAKRLGEWPLLLKLVNGTLRDRVQNTRADLAVAIEYANRALDKRGLTFFDVRNAEARHQAVALTLGVSLELLTDDERACYRTLAVFPEDVEIPLPTLQKYWGLDDFTTEEICTRLMQMSLLLSYDSTTQRIRLHDIVRHFLIGQQTDQMPTLHQILLDTHHPFVPLLDAPVWSELPDDEPYFWEHLAQHLIEAGRGEELVATVKDWRYLAKKTFLHKSHAVEKDLLAAEKIVSADDPLQTLRRNFVNAGHLLSRCETENDLAVTLYSRLQHLRELAFLVTPMERNLPRPFPAPQQPLPDLPSPALIRTLTGHLGVVWCGAISADGQTIVSASSDTTLKIWDTQTGIERFTLKGHRSRVYGCAIDADGRTVVSASLDGTLKVWDAKTGRETHSLIGHHNRVYSCSISADGRTIVSSSRDETLKVWDAETGAERHILRGHGSVVWGCAISADGRVIVSSSKDETLKVWDAQTGAEQFMLRGHNDMVNNCAISPDGKTIVSASSDKSLIVWNACLGSLQQMLNGHKNTVNSCAISPDGLWLVSASEDGTIKVWDIRTGVERYSLLGHSGSVNSCAISGDGKLIISASSDETLKVWDARVRIERQTLNDTNIVNCAISNDGRHIVYVTEYGLLKIWEVSTGGIRELGVEDDGNYYGCALSGDGKYLASSLAGKTLKVWDLSVGIELLTLEKHRGEAHSFAISGNGEVIVSLSEHEGISLRDVGTGGLLNSFFSFMTREWGCAISADGQTIVSIGGGGELTVYDAQTGEEGFTLWGHEGVVNSCAISADGSVIVSASADKTLVIWNALTGEAQHTLRGHQEWVLGCAISPDNSLIVSVSSDMTLKLWSADTGACLTTLQTDGPLSDCAISGDSKTIVAAGARGLYLLRLVQ